MVGNEIVMSLCVPGGQSHSMQLTRNLGFSNIRRWLACVNVHVEGLFLFMRLN